MLRISTAMREQMPRIRGALELEPSITLDLSRAGPHTVAVFIYCRMGPGVDEPDAIFQELRLRGCRLDRETFDFLMTAYEGDDPSRHLWSHYKDDGYYLTMFNPAAAADEDEDDYIY